MKAKLVQELQNNRIQYYIGILFMLCVTLWVILFTVLLTHDYYTFAAFVFVIPAIILHQIITILGEELL